MLQRDSSQPPFGKKERVSEPPRLPRPNAPLPRFELQEADQPLFGEGNNSPSLAPLASDISEDEWEPTPVSEGARRARAAALFATIIVPICLLAAFELITVGDDMFSGVLPAAEQRLMSAQSWGASLIAGRSETHAAAIERESL